MSFLKIILYLRVQYSYQQNEEVKNSVIGKNTKLIYTNFKLISICQTQNSLSTLDSRVDVTVTVHPPLTQRKFKLHFLNSLSNSVCDSHNICFHLTWVVSVDRTDIVTPIGFTCLTSFLDKILLQLLDIKCLSYLEFCWLFA